MDNKHLSLTDEEYAVLKELLFIHGDEEDFQFNYRGQVLTTHRSMSLEIMNTLGLNTEGNDGEPQFWIDLDPIADLEDETPEPVVEYPEHQKLKAISHDSNAIGAFLDWLPQAGIALHDLNAPKQMEQWEMRTLSDEFYPVRKSIQDILAEYFKIDQKLIDQEKQAMMDSLPG